MSIAIRPAELQRRVRRSDTLRLSMAHLSPGGLSEQWVLREGGDRHWELIANAYRLDRAVFYDEERRMIYAAFCATSLSIAPSALNLLGEDIVITSELFSVGRTQLGSRHSIKLSGGHILCQLQMITTFVTHDKTRSNRRITRAQPSGSLAPLAIADSELSALALRARDNARNCRDAAPTAPPIHIEAPCPSIDFNAVGLLYFPTFSRIAATAAWRSAQMRRPIKRRDVYYFGNVDPGDYVGVHRAGDALIASRGDAKIVALIETSYTEPDIAPAL